MSSTNQWTVLGKAGKYLDCVCSCGTRKLVLRSNIRAGYSKSCGCNSRRVTSERNRTHGKARSYEWRCWVNMKSRCYNPRVPAYPLYGGRGIKVCDRWLKFEGFFADMGSAPERFTIERIDVNGDYCPENCKWASIAEQARNKRNSVRVTAFGKSALLCDLAQSVGLPYLALYKRIVTRGWDPERAITTPLRGQSPGYSPADIAGVLEGRKG